MKVGEELEAAKQAQTVISTLSISSAPDPNIVAALRKVKDVAAQAKGVTISGLVILTTRWNSDHTNPQSSWPHVLFRNRKSTPILAMRLQRRFWI